MLRIRRGVLCGLGTICVLSIALYSKLHIWFAVRSQPHPWGLYLQPVTPDSLWVVWDTTESSTGLVEYGLTRELGHEPGTFRL